MKSAKGIADKELINRQAEQDRIQMTVDDNERHMRQLVRWCASPEGKRFGLERVLAVGSTVASRIEAKYGEATNR